MHSAIQRMMKAKNRLPVDLADIYSALFQENKSPDQICAEKKISMDEFEARRANMLRSLRAASA